ncbi:MAG: hypothetical protein AAFX05_02095 [Planctomycetota bacterium]
MFKSIAAAATVMAMAGAAHAYTVDFSSGPEGWSANGNDTIINVGGANGDVMHQYQFDGFFQEIRNSTNPLVTGDYTQKGTSIDISVDIDVHTLRSTFNPGQSYVRELVIELRDYDNPGTTYPWASVWAMSSELMNPAVDGFVTHSWTIDTTATDLPAGWGGTGAEDPNTFEPILPAGTSWQEVLANVDEIVFSTAVPGFFYGFTEWEFDVDNIVFDAVPAPGAAGLLAVGGMTMTRRRRR